MTKEEVVSFIKQHLTQTIEEMSFIFLYDGVETVKKDSGVVSVTIEVEGGINGKIGLICSGELSMVMARNILCLDDSEINQDMVRDTIAEVLNTVAGRVMESATEKGGYRISLPIYDCGVVDDSDVLNMSSDEGNITVVININ